MGSNYANCPHTQGLQFKAELTDQILLKNTNFHFCKDHIRYTRTG